MAGTPTAGDDSIIGTGANENINGLAGNDTINGLDGNDTLGGQSGNDVIDGGGGNDLLTGGLDNDTLIGGVGNDSLTGSSGNDSLVGGDGTNFLQGDEGNDTLIGGGYTIALWGFSPSIVLDVGAGTAQDGLGGTDTFSAITEFRATTGADQLSAGNSAQSSIVFYPFTGNDTITGVANDTTGRVQVNLSTNLTAATIDLGLGQATVGANVKTLTNIHNVVGTPLNDTVIGSAGNDFYTTSGGRDQVNLLGGDDTVFFPVFGGDIDLGTGFNTADFHLTGQGLRFTGTTPPVAAAIGGPANDTPPTDNSVTNWDIKTLASIQFVDTLFKVSRIVGTPFDDVIVAMDVAPRSPQQVFFRDNLKTVDNGLQYGVNVIIEGREGNDSGSGNFIADYHSSPQGIQLNGSAGTGYLVNDGWGSQDSWSFNFGVRDTSHADTFNFTNQIGTLILTGGNDTVTAGSGTLVIIDSPLFGINLDLGAGQLTYPILGQQATINGPKSFLYLGPLASTLQGDATDNALGGGDGDDSLLGGGGNDTLIGGKGDDTVDGVTGIDTWLSAQGLADYRIFIRDVTDRPYGANAIEGVLAFINQANPDDRGVDAVRGIENFAFDGGDSVATLDDLIRQIPNGTPITSFNPTNGLNIGGVPALVGPYGNGSVVFPLGPGSGVVNADGGGFDDLLIGLANFGLEQPNIAPPGATAEIAPAAIDAVGDGDDRLRGGDGSDTLIGRSGDDEIEGENGNDTILADNGNDSVGGGPGDDLVLGGDGDDFLIGDGGNDLLLGGDGADILYGDSGNDTLRIDVDDLAAIGGAGSDVLELSSGAIGMTAFDLSAVANQNTSGIGPIIRSIEDIDASVAPAPVTITGGGETGSHLFGSRFADTITGGPGSDLIAGQAGNDSLGGGGGADTIVSGLGNDTVSGGTGADLFVHDGGTGTMRILDFHNGGDNLQVPAGAGFASPEAIVAALIQGPDGAVLALVSGGSVVLVGVAPAALSTDDFSIL